MTLLLSLTITSLFSASMWVVYVLNRFAVVGMFHSMGTPSDDWPALSPWAQRAKAAHANAIENLVVFVPLALLAHVSLKDPSAMSAAAMAGMLFLGARVVHFACYTLSIPYLRTVSFLGGYGATVWLAMLLVGL